MQTVLIVLILRTAQYNTSFLFIRSGRDIDYDYVFTSNLSQDEQHCMQITAFTCTELGM